MDTSKAGTPPTGTRNLSAVRLRFRQIFGIWKPLRSQCQVTLLVGNRVKFYADARWRIRRVHRMGGLHSLPDSQHWQTY